MIFLDTNIFLRFLMPGTDEQSVARRAIADSIFAAAERDELKVTTTEVVLHELCYVLASKKQYGLPASEIAEILATLLRLPGFTLPPGDRRIYLRALDIYVADPKLEFADAIAAARVERLGIPLATFDDRLGRLPSITRWEPPASPTGS